VLTCRELTENTTDYLERRVGWWTRMQLRLHLALCRHCRHYVAQIRATIAFLRRSPMEPPAPAAEERLVQCFMGHHRSVKPDPAGSTDETS
jgi:anti-sigma factor RsiW